MDSDKLKQNEKNQIKDEENLELWLFIFVKPLKAFRIIKKHYLNHSLPSKVLFGITWWMILTYWCFMPDYFRKLFYTVKPAFLKNFVDKYDVYLNNFRVFAGFTLFGYILFLWILVGILKIFKLNFKVKQISTSLFFIYSLNLVLFLALVLVGRLGIDYFVLFASLLKAYYFILIALSVHLICEIRFTKSVLITLISVLLNSGILFFIFSKIYF